MRKWENNQICISMGNNETITNISEHIQIKNIYSDKKNIFR